MTKPIHFEKTMIELEEIVMQLEKGELSLEDSLKQFEKGITLARRCQDVLSQAEQKIETLTLSNIKDSEQFDGQ
ncbi:MULTISPECIES: exodeoxyribonuclease VII small subunit [Legionella]|uniref:Exodeoxyribonuclease 7 small subunit n=1 Tax=Legionella feeleii TaxID=453 RepID=A0A0W0TLC6_9GAMM|nr:MULTISPECIES: exodeoxyribonuclease VII small subunit [Legionella]KTC96377.1 exodeoxyribonuclease VII small subunit [Legionella feeleii]MCC5013673.1 exodeoxyribonuclease VII small subunit [Legionella sp. 31fI33]